MRVAREVEATSPIEVFRATSMQRVQLLKHGLSARDALIILGSLGLSQARACKAVKVSRASVNAKARRGEALPLPEAERVLGLAKLIGQVQKMVQDSGDPEGFRASAWISSWLVTPLPALSGMPPIELLDSMEGQGLIAILLSQIEGGVYA